MNSPLGIAHLTLLDVAPPELISLAAAAGLDFVGLRVRAVTDSEPMHDLRPGSATAAETRRRLDDTGLVVRDIEFLPLEAGTGPDTWLPVLDAGASLGAGTLSVTGADHDRARLVDTLARLVQDAAPYGIRPTLEPISYQPVARLAEAAPLAREAGAAVLVDTLHLHRAGEGPADVAALAPDLVPLVQLCDAPFDSPADVDGRRREARQQRAIPGEGGLPLAEVLAACPPGTPVSLEVPSAARPGPAEFLRRLRVAAESLQAQHV